MLVLAIIVHMHKYAQMGGREGGCNASYKRS